MNYCIGDVHGCYHTLKALLDHIEFKADRDVLWFAGDLVNRGHYSAQVLDLVRQLANSGNAYTVLGNHDIHLLAAASEAVDTGPAFAKCVEQVRQHPKAFELLDWLRQQPFLIENNDLNFCLVHAGLLPALPFEVMRSLQETLMRLLQSADYRAYLAHDYSDSVLSFDPTMDTTAQWLCGLNMFTRLRYCTLDGKMAFPWKMEPANAPSHIKPWFLFDDFMQDNDRWLAFGHWSTLNGQSFHPKHLPLDQGCSKGLVLAAYALEEQTWFRVTTQAEDLQ